MFKNLFSSNQTSRNSAEADAATTRSDGTPTKSILRRSRFRKNTVRKVSWSETFDTLEPDTTYEEARDDDYSLIRDFNWVYNGESVYTSECDSEETFGVRDGVLNSDSSNVESEYSDDATYLTGTMMSENSDHDCAVQTARKEYSNQSIPKIDIETSVVSSETEKVTIVDNEITLDDGEYKKKFESLACASSLSEAKVIDKYGYCGEQSNIIEEQKRESILEIAGEAVIEVKPTNDDEIKPFLPSFNAVDPEIDDLALQNHPSHDSITICSLSADEITLTGNSYEDHSFIDRQTLSDDGSIASLRKKEHQYHDVFEKQHKADVSHGHIGLILPFIDHFRCGAFTDDLSIESLRDEKKLKTYNRIENLGGEKQEIVINYNNNLLEEIPTTFTDNENILMKKAKIPETNEESNNTPIDEKKINGSAEIPVDNHDIVEGTSRTGSNNEQLMLNEKGVDRVTADSSSGSPALSVSDESPRPELVGQTILFHSDEDSISSNECPKNVEQLKAKNSEKTKGMLLKPFITLQKRIARAAKVFTNKSNKKKIPEVQSRFLPSSTLDVCEGLHDRLYHENIPAIESCVTTETILNDLQIIENTAKAMYRDRFKDTPPFFNLEFDADGMTFSWKNEAEKCHSASLLK